MPAAFKVGYSLVVAILLILFVILGTRTLYDEPDPPTSGSSVAYEQYEDDRVDYHRNVFIVAMVLGVAAVAAGLYLFRRVEALPLGILLGGFGVVIFAWAQAAGDFDEIGMAPLFAVVAVGLVIVLAAGYRFLGAALPAADAGRRKPEN